MAGCAYLRYSNSKYSTTAPTKSSQTTNKTPVSVPSPKKTAELGETVKFDGLEFTITEGPSFSEWMGGLNGLIKAKNNMVYCTIKVTVKNTGYTSKSIGGTLGGPPYTFTLDYNNGYKYNTSFAKYADFFESCDIIRSLEVLSDKLITFEVPSEVATNTAAPLKLSLKYNSIYRDDEITWKLR